MKSPHFQFPDRNFPGLVRHIATPEMCSFLFAEIAGDKGLRNAVKTFWNLRTITVTATSSIGTFAYTGPAIPDSYTPISRSIPKDGDYGKEPIGMPSTMGSDPQFSQFGIFEPGSGSIPHTAIFVFSDIVFIESFDRYALTMMQFYGAEGTVVAGTGDYMLGTYQHYYAYATLAPAHPIAVTLPSELEPIKSASPCGFELDPTSNVTPSVTLGFTFWEYE